MLQLQEGEKRGEGINLEKELGEDTLQQKIFSIVRRDTGKDNKKKKEGIQEKIFIRIGRDTGEVIYPDMTGYVRIYLAGQDGILELEDIQHDRTEQKRRYLANRK